MIFNLLLVAFALLVAWDFGFTLRRVKKYGEKIEINPVVLAWMKILGPTKGLVVSILLFSATLGAAIYILHWTVFLALLVGIRLQLLEFQVMSISQEAFLDEYLKLKEKP